MKIGIIGGTFNPIHNGHIALGEAVKDFYDEVWFMTAGVSYLKLSSCHLSGLDRHHMVEATLQDVNESCFKASSMEIERFGDSYTYETMQTLSKLYPNDEFTFIYGSDCLFHIEFWKNASYLFENGRFLFAHRITDDFDKVVEKKEELFRKYAIQCDIFKVELPNISSTMIREAVPKGDSIEDMVTPSVYTIILEKGYYRETD